MTTNKQIKFIWSSFIWVAELSEVKVRCRGTRSSSSREYDGRASALAWDYHCLPAFWPIARASGSRMAIPSPAWAARDESRKRRSWRGHRRWIFRGEKAWRLELGWRDRSCLLGFGWSRLVLIRRWVAVVLQWSSSDICLGLLSSAGAAFEPVSWCG